MPARPSSSSSATNSRNAAAPYSRRPSSQPKSSRQQFSACGACRMRRVRCDLKDLSIASASAVPTCSNCKERGIKCVDEFADVKAVKLLRRGRRLQQVEAIYGKSADQEGDTLSSPSPPSGRSTRIPSLQVDFFVSPFWRWLMVQRPILDSAGFSARFLAHTRGTQPLGTEGGLIAMLLVVWAASFGLNERGLPENNDREHDLVSTSSDPSNGNQHEDISTARAKNVSFSLPQRKWKERTEAMLREVLELIDFHGVLRRPTLDGVRVLLLLLPLMEDALPLERLAIYEATLSQVQAICTLSPPSSSNQTSSSVFDEAAVRARIFWYAYTQEGLLTGMRGGRFVLNNEDLECFQRTLPSLNSSVHTPNSPSDGDVMSTCHLLSSHEFSHPSPRSYIRLINGSSMPLHLSDICRRIHMALTGIKAARRAEEHGLIDAQGMHEIWRDLDHCWREFEAIRRGSQFSDYDIVHKDQYASGWQIFIFECHNVIRESLKQYMSTISQEMDSHSRPSSHSSNLSPYLSPHYLHATATRKCMTLLPSVVRIIHHHTSHEREQGECGLFTWDTGLVRDGCFFAAYLAVSHPGGFLDVDDREHRKEIDGPISDMTSEEAVSICLTALSRMRWAFSKSEEREETIRMMWENKQDGRQAQSSGHRNLGCDSRRGYLHPSAASNSQHIDLPPRPQTMSGLSTHTDRPTLSSFSHNPQHIDLPSRPQTMSALFTCTDRPTLPSLDHFAAQRRVESAPTTACSVDGRGANGWPHYTPPGTGTSIATSAGTSFSARDESSAFPSVGTYKLQPDDAFYNDMDQFSFHAPLTGPMVGEPAPFTNLPNFNHRGPTPDSHHLGVTEPSSFINSNVFPPASIHPDFNSCPQFGDDCGSGPYH